ncbi:MAG: PQQ-binding-like beta-propeller repeat protein [Spirochaetia bacterium]
MIYRLLRAAIVTLASCAALTGFSFLVVHDPVEGLAPNLPGTDGRPEARPSGTEIKIGEFFRSFDGTPSALTASWPRFRGSYMDNTSHESVPLVSPSAGWHPQELWTVELGEGHAGAAVANGRVYVLDYDERRQADSLRCFSLDDGKEIWRRWYTVRLKRNHGISRTVPAVDSRFVVTIGPSCIAMCCDARTGELLWGADLPARFGGEVPLWYTGQCPLIDGKQAVMAVGGNALLVGFDLPTGKVVWQTPNPSGLKTSHSSVMLATIQGTRTYVYAAIGGIVGVSAEPGNRGTLLWESRAFDATVIAPSPVVLGDGRVFVTAGYGAGSIMLKVSHTGPTFTARVLYRYGPADGFACEHQTPLLYHGMLIGILPKDAGPRRSELACWDPAGRWVWSSGQTRRFGLGPYLIADGKLVILNEDGVLWIAQASTEAFLPLGSAKILPGPDAWAPMALVSGRLIARDSRRMVCVDLRGKG